MTIKLFLTLHGSRVYIVNILPVYLYTRVLNTKRTHTNKRISLIDWTEQSEKIFFYTFFFFFQWLSKYIIKFSLSSKCFSSHPFSQYLSWNVQKVRWSVLYLFEDSLNTIKILFYYERNIYALFRINLRKKVIKNHVDWLNLIIIEHKYTHRPARQLSSKRKKKLYS